MRRPGITQIHKTNVCIFRKNVLYYTRNDFTGVYSMEKLTQTQQKVYDYLVQKVHDGVPPSVREIGSAVGLRSTSSVQANLNALESKGYISRDPMHKRSIRIVGQGEPATFVPLLGTVAAGQPLLAVEQIEEYIPYSGKLSSDKSLFALHVKGESMIEAGILDGDIVIAEQSSAAENGEMVIALVDDEATVKTFYKENGQYRLQPANEAFAPIIVDHVNVLGKVVAVFRYY